MHGNLNLRSRKHTNKTGRASHGCSWPAALITKYIFREMVSKAAVYGGGLHFGHMEGMPLLGSVWFYWQNICAQGSVQNSSAARKSEIRALLMGTLGESWTQKGWDCKDHPVAGRVDT